ncbi:MAG: sugar phosphate nucleotidyltransferase [Candidatus Limnocylindrales bacterium]|jgi:glucose-1-phosphate adenylyltransferase
MDGVLAVVLAGGAGERLSCLSAIRSKPAVPFGGKYRLIDFSLSNCVNSDIDDVLVLAQYNPRSLIDHIGTGRPWDLDRMRGGGIKILQPYMSRGHSGWYMGTADAVRYNLHEIDQDGAELVLVLAGDHVYKMDYRPMIAAHRRTGAAVTVAVRTVPPAEAYRMGILSLDSEGRVTDWEEKPAAPKSDLASMGVYVFNRAALREWLDESRSDFGRDVIPAMLAGGAAVFGHRFDGYWRDVGTIEAYWAANLDLTALVPELDLFDRSWLVHTRSEERSPAKMGPDAIVRHSLISHGCIVNGMVVNSVLSPGVTVYEGALVRDSIVLLDTEIGPGAVVDTAIIDKFVRVGAGAVVGFGSDLGTLNVDEPEHLCTGITLIGERACIPAGVRIGRNCLIEPSVVESDFPGPTVESGASVRRPDSATAPATPA